MPLRRACLVLLLSLVPSSPAGAELQAATVAAYEEYIASLERRFAVQAKGSLSIDHAAGETERQLREGEILAWPGHEDGIIDVADGLIHHWRSAVFIPDATLEAVLAVAQDYAAYAGTYPWVIRSTLIGRERRTRGDRYRVLLRIKRSARMVTSVVDLWTVVDYHYPAPDRAAAASHADCVRQIERDGRPDERRLPVGQGKGYLWRANTYATYLQRDGGVYVDLQNVGLSRDFPPLLGWVIEPIARRLGRGSATEALKQLRATVAGGTREGVDAAPPVPDDRASWCSD